MLVTDYPTASTAAMGFVHTRNINYNKFGGVHIDVLSFRAAESYSFEGISVHTLADYKQNLAGRNYDLLISHAPNLREHLRFLRKYEYRFPRIVFFFHGHEILRRNEEYPWPYAFRRKERLVRTFIQGPYDAVKLLCMGRMIERLRGKIHLVFVSDWLKRRFIRNVRLRGMDIDSISSVIHNAVGEVFCAESFDPRAPKKGDFITIRSNMDNSTYAMDNILKLAQGNPSLSFHVIGKGSFFEHYHAPANLTYHLGKLSHWEIAETLNRYRYALMPTRNDTQGVMSCEMAMFGIPLVTSDIEICREILGGMVNVAFLDNGKPESTDLRPVVNAFDAGRNNKHVTKFSLRETVGKEMALFQMLTGPGETK